MLNAVKIKKTHKKLLLFIVILTIIFFSPLLVIGKLALFPAQTHTTKDSASGLVNTDTRPSLPPGNDWPMYLYNVERTANNPETVLSTSNVNQITKLWSFKTGGSIASAATVVKGTIYFGSWDGYEYALDELTGTLKWKTFLGLTHAKAVCNPPKPGISSGAAVQDGTVYVGGGDAYWYALNANTGKILWKVYTGDNSETGGHYNWSSPILYNGSAYIGIASLGDCPLIPGQLLRVDLQTHKVAETFNTTGPKQIGGGVWTSPSIDPTTNTIFISTGTETMPTQPYAQAVIALDATTLQVKQAWKLPGADAIGDSDFDTTPILFHDAQNTPLVAAVNKDGLIFVFNRNAIASGPIWQNSFNIAGTCPICEFSSVSSNAYGQNTLYVGAGDTDIGNNVYRGSVTAMDPSNGNYLWRDGSVSGPVIGALAYSNGLVVAGMGTDLSVLDASTGARLYSYNMNAFMFSAPVISHGQIYEGSTDGTFYAFGLGPSASGSISKQGCAKGWSCQDIGGPVITGSQHMSGRTITMSVGGSGMANTFDQFHFLAKKESGDQQLTTEVTSQQLTGASGQTQLGLMVRQNSNPSSPYYGFFISPQKGLITQYREAFGGITTSNTQPIETHLPIYLNVQRHGDQFQAAYSTNGKNFTLLPGSTVNVVMPTMVESGLVAASLNEETMVTAHFQNVTFGPPDEMAQAPAPSTICPKGWTCNDIGNPGELGSQTLADTVWAIKGSGTDIWNAADQFHYVYQNLGPATSISARVLSFDSSTLSAKAGIMIRQDNTPSSAYYAIFVEPAANHTRVISVEARDNKGVISRGITAISGNTALPVSLKIVHTATTIEAYSSTDGTDWNLINNSTLILNIQKYTPGTTINLNINTAIAGLAVSAHDDSQSATATFDELTIN